MKNKPNTDKIIQFNPKGRVEDSHEAFKRVNRVNSKKQVIAVTSGKGGVGKTNIVANVGYSLCREGKRVLVFDADLGLGNIDILLGLAPRYNLSHVIAGEKRIRDIIVSGPGDMKILPASSGVQELTRLSEQQKKVVLQEIDELLEDFDVLLIDTAAGISSNVLYFNVAAQDIVVVVTPEPTSITDAYALMKVLSIHHSQQHFNLIINQVSSEQEGHDIYRQLNLVSDRFLDISLTYMGYVLLDESITKGVKKQKIASELYPGAESSRCFRRLAKRVWQLDSDANGWRGRDLFSDTALGKKLE